MYLTACGAAEVNNHLTIYYFKNGKRNNFKKTIPNVFKNNQFYNNYYDFLILSIRELSVGAKKVAVVNQVLTSI